MSYAGFIFCILLVSLVRGQSELEKWSNDVKEPQTLSLNFEDAPKNVNIHFKRSPPNSMQAEIEQLRSTVDRTLLTEFSLSQTLEDFYLKQKLSFADWQEKLSKQLDNEISSLTNELKKTLGENIQAQLSIQTSKAANQFDEHFNWPGRRTYADCNEALNANQQKNGVYVLDIKKDSLKPFGVYCQFDDGKPWTIIQRRQDGSVDFFRNWNEYQNGFGDLNGEYWLGLNRIHAITSIGKHELWLQMETFEGETRSLRYEEFFVDDETTFYRLKVNGFNDFTGKLDDKLSYNDGQKFSTFDNDNDMAGYNCADNRKGAWWYDNCSNCNPNGKYIQVKNGQGIHCGHWHEPMKYIHMAISQTTKPAEDAKNEVDDSKTNDSDETEKSAESAQFEINHSSEETSTGSFEDIGPTTEGLRENSTEKDSSNSNESKKSDETETSEETTTTVFDENTVWLGKSEMKLSDLYKYDGEQSSEETAMHAFYEHLRERSVMQLADYIKNFESRYSMQPVKYTEDPEEEEAATLSFDDIEYDTEESAIMQLNDENDQTFFEYEEKFF